MTKPQNTKNEQQKDLCITSEQLTEQWKKGELLDGEDYYIKWKDSEVFAATFVDFMNRKMFQRMELEFEELPIEHYLSVLAPVPSYDEWQAKLEENKRLKHDVGNLGYKIKNQRKEIERQIAQNAQLKELLKECSIANTALVSIMDWLRESTIPEQRENCEKLFEKTQELQKQLDEALK